MTDSPATLRPELSDLDLVRRAQMDDISAYEQLIRRYHSRVYGFTYGMTAHRPDAENLSQQVFVKALKALGHFREQTGFENWIRCIALTRVIHTREKRRHRKTNLLEDFDPDIKQSDSYKEFSSKGSVLRKMSLSAFQKEMNEALATLPEKLRAVLILHDVQGRGAAEIAKVMNGSENTVRSRLDSAHKKLYHKLAGLGGSENTELDLTGLLALKAYERPDKARAEKNIEDTLRAVRTAHKRPSIHHFPDKSMGWMFAQPRYGVAALFILFLVLHLLDRPLPEAPAESSVIEKPTMGVAPPSGISTNTIVVPELPAIDPVHPSLIQQGTFIESNP